jgi:mono/diheme cytochrome c family protein
MRTFISRILLATVFIAAWHFAEAEPVTYSLPDETATFRTEPGSEVAQNNCLACHSADYIQMQPSGKGKAFWESEVTKMINSYHAPIDEADAKAIVDYLARTY